MSDINDLIARSSVLAYKSGYQQGKLDERKLIMDLAKKAQAHGAPIIETDRIGDYVYLVDLYAYLKESDEKIAN